jgi:dUTP pyrophosphatase
MKVTLLSGKLTKATPLSACYDVYAAQDALLTPNSVTVVGTGLRTKMEGCFALLLDRSGLAAKYGVSRRAGVIDTDYDQEWKVVLVHEGKEAYQVRAGDRICQCLFLPIQQVKVVGGEVKEVERVGGFGSTGK